MTTEIAIEVIKFTNDAIFGGQLKSLDVAIKSMKFLSFLADVIPPNEMKKYIDMYNCSNDKNNC